MAYQRLAFNYIALNRFDEAKAMLDEARARNLESIQSRLQLARWLPAERP